MFGKLLDTISGRSRRQAEPPAPRPAPAPEPAPPPPPPAATALPFEIRPLEAGDLAALPDLFRASIEHLTQHEQGETARVAWAAEADAPDFPQELTRGVTVVALKFGEPVAFAQLAPLDYLNRIHVHPDAAGEGIATLLFQYLEDEARIAGSTGLRTHASHSARRFFSKSGFQERHPESVEHGGHTLERLYMEKPL